jgi:hypothetical protein
MKRTRPRAPSTLRRFAVLALITVATTFVGTTIRHALATPESSVVYSVSQSPASGAVLQVGDILSFTINVTSAPGGFTGPVVYDLKKPTSMSFGGWGNQAGNIITSCSDNSPAAGYVRCTVGNGNSISAGGLDTGTAQEIVLNFTVDAAAAGTLYSTATIQALFTDVSSGFRNAGDAADPVGGDDTSAGSVGGITVANILGTNSNISVATSPSPSAIFEGSLTTITATFTHALALAATLQPIDITVTNGDIQTGTVTCPGGTGTASILGNVARCTGSTVSNASSMTVTVRAQDTGAGGDILAVVSAPSLGLPYSEAAASTNGTGILTVTVDEVGLQTVTLPSPGAAAPPWIVSSPIAVCTMGVGADVANDAAAGLAQNPALVAGTSTLALVTPLAAADFAVSGPSGSVAFTYLSTGGAECGASQSGVQFTPSSSGSYTVTAYYNGDTSSGPARSATYGTNALALTVATSNPAPSITSLSPNNVNAGSAGFTIAVNGTGFVAGSIVRWNGSDRGTTYLSATQLTASVLGTDVASSGTATVTVFNPAPGGGASGGSAFTMNNAPNPAPLTSSLNPNSANAGSPGFTVTVAGSSFVPGAIVRWNGADRVTNYISGTQVTANILTADLASAGTANVAVFNPSPGGGTSPSLTFTITTAPNPIPSVTSLNPATVNVGGATFTLTVNGTGFVASSVVRLNGSDRTTTYVSATQVTASIPASDIASTGTATVAVFNGAPGGGLSSTTGLPIQNPVPAITTLSPTTIGAANGAFTLTVNGTRFISGSVVRWSGSDRVTTFVNATQVTAAITAADVAATGTATITVFNPTPGGGASPGTSFTVGNPVGQTTNKLVITPEALAFTPRSRLTFSAASGDLAPASVAFVIKRGSDNKYWNGSTHLWEATVFENAAAQSASSGPWSVRVEGEDRRLFVSTDVTVEVRAVAASVPYKGALDATFHVR